MILLQPNDDGPDLRITLGPQRETHRLFHIGERGVRPGNCFEVKQRQSAVNARVKRALRVRLGET